MINRDTFYQHYLIELDNQVRLHPNEYTFRPDQVRIVVDRMMKAIDERHYNKDGPALRAVCRKLKIKHTYTAIAEYLNGGN